MSKLPNYKEHNWLDVRYANNCRKYNEIVGCRISNGAYLSMMLTRDNFGVLTFVISDQHSVAHSTYQNYGESLLAIAHRAKRTLKAQ